MVEWHSSPTNVTRVRSLDPRHMKVEFVVCFFQVLRFSSLHEKQHFLFLIRSHARITSTKLFRYTWVNKLH